MFAAQLCTNMRVINKVMLPVLWLLMIFIASEVSSEVSTKVPSNTISEVLPVASSEKSTGTLAKSSSEQPSGASLEPLLPASSAVSISFLSKTSSEPSSEASLEASSEASTEASSEVSSGASTKTLSEASTEVLSEASTGASSGASTEASSEASIEASPEASIEASSEASIEASSEDIRNEVGLSSDLESSVFKLADSIYDQQKVCDAYVGEAIVNTIENGSTNELPKPNEKYSKCMKELNRQKRKYIKSFLVGLNYHSKGFPIRLSNMREVTLPFPSYESSDEDTKLRFDIQQQLCMTNLLCETLAKMEVKTDEDIEEQKKCMARCLNVLNHLKLKYIDVNNEEKSEFEKDQRLTLVCAGGEVALPLPAKTTRKDNETPPPTMTSEETKISFLDKGKEEQAQLSQPSAYVLADFTFDKQKECDTYVNKTVLKTLETGTTEFPKPDEKYIQCIKTLNTYKKEYINHFLLGMNYYSKIFPLMLPNKQFITLPVPPNTGLSIDVDSDFDIEQEICVTNKICLALINHKFSNLEAADINDRKLKVFRCLNFLNDLKHKYIKVKQLNELDKGQGLPLSCTYGEITLALPEKKEYVMFRDSPPPTVSETPKIMYTDENHKRNKDLNIDEPVKIESFSGNNDDADQNKIKLNADKMFEKKAADEQEYNNDVRDNKIRGFNEKEEIKNTKSKTEKTAEENKDKTIEPFKSNNAFEETKVSPDDIDATATEAPATTKRLPKVLSGPKNNGRHLELTKYETKYVPNNPIDKVMQFKETERAKKAELGINTSKEQGLNSNDEEKRRQQLKSLGDNIILLEKDCQELLEFGERLLQHKILSSLTNLETHYNECIRKSDALKTIYIENQKLNVTSYKHFFPLTLSTGESKLVSVPAQFLKPDAVESQPSPDLNPGDDFRLVDFFRKSGRPEKTTNIRKPFDNPAFMTNEEFFKRLQQGFVAEGMSPLSKVAAALHISGNHNNNKNGKIQFSKLDG